MNWIDTNDLKLWSGSPKSKVGLPELISRLIRATVSDLKDLHIPKESQTYRGGWDGVVHSKMETEFIPSGVSQWEFGTESSFKPKAEKDYTKRKMNPLGEDPAESTFVFVTPRIWEKKDEWIREKLAEGVWRDVRVYDAEKLVEWLSVAPVQSHWLANEIGKATSEAVLTTDDFWSGWSKGRDYDLPPQIITAGRQAAVEELQQKLSGQPAIIAIQAATREEAIAFFIGAAKQWEIEAQENILSRGLILEHASAFRQITANYQGLFLIAKFENSNGFYSALGNKHFVIVPMGPDEDRNSFPDAIKLTKLGREPFIAALKSIGLPEEKAEALSKETGRNITVLKRREAFGNNSLPAWAKPEHARELIPALLLGKWSEEQTGDKELLAQLAGDSYQNYIATLAKWKHTPDPPIYQIGTTWRLASPLDAWSSVMKLLASADIDRLRAAFLSVAKWVKPGFELTPEQRPMAVFHGEDFRYSDWARKGLAQSVIIIALYGEKLDLSLPAPQSWADALIRELLQDVSESLWASLSDLFPLLAEASPTAFMASIEGSLKDANPTVLGLFTETESFLFSQSHHAPLLWALEEIAWFPEYLSRSALLLAHMALNDPGGKTINRPINSLRSIFLPWNPQTLATAETRMKVLNAIKSKFPSIAWRLGAMLLPKPHDWHSPNQTFRWRMGEKDGATYPTWADIFSFYAQLVDFLLSFEGKEPRHLLDLIEAYPELQPVEREKIIDFIAGQIDAISDPEQSVRNALRVMLNHHRSCSKMDWALPEEELLRLEDFYNKLTPDSPVEAYKWMFDDHWLQFPSGKEEGLTHEEQSKIFTAKRVEALEQIQAQIGFDGMLELCTIYKPEVLGDAVGYLLKNEDDFHRAFAVLIEEGEQKKYLLHALVFRIFWLNGLDWVANLYNRSKTAGASVNSLAMVLLPLPLSSEVLDFIEGLEEEVSHIYWQRTHSRFALLETKDKLRVLQKLLLHQRFHAALEFVYDYDDDKIPSEMLVEVLEKLATQPSSDFKQIAYYKIPQLFEALDARDDVEEGRIVALELRYLPALTGAGSSYSPKRLHKEIGDNPESFITVLKWKYRPQGESLIAEETSGLSEEQILAHAKAGWGILNSWKRIPGSDEQGNINYEHLRRWIDEVRLLAEKADRSKVADAEIGAILAQCRANVPEWPGEEICKIIDTINSDSLSRNFSSGIFNRYGSTTRGVFDGGQIERSRSTHFRSLAHLHAPRWPVTASILESLANHYELMARQEDNRAEQDESEY